MRPEARAKLGYYPTPPETLKRIAAMLYFDRDATLLDPCCGTGAALNALGGEVCTRWGAELDLARAKEASSKLDHVVTGDALKCEFSGKCDLLYLNPPYDNKGKLELAFLKHYLDALPGRGTLLYLVPEPHLGVYWPTLREHFEDVAIYRLPENEYEQFRQIVVLAKRRESPGELAPVPAVQPLPARPESRVYVTNAKKRFELYLPFESGDDLRSLIETAGLWQKIFSETESKDVQLTKPLMPLRDGHLVQLVAAGLLNNRLVESNGKRLLIRGRSFKDAVETTEYGETTKTVTVREVMKTELTALDLDTADLYTVT